MGALLIGGLLSIFVAISLVQDAVNSINCDAKWSENLPLEGYSVLEPYSS